ncbi:hypothetical protein Aperf_G00000004017 [Anoplocephala perfoliata]
MANPKCLDVSEHSLLAPPLSEAFDELRLSTVSLLANASSNPSGQSSRESAEQFFESPRTSSAISPSPYFQQFNEEMEYFNQKPIYGSCTLLTDLAKHEDSISTQASSISLDVNMLKRLRHNSASPTFPVHNDESKPLNFNTEAPENSNILAHPKPCYVLHVNLTEMNTETVERE